MSLPGEWVDFFFRVPALDHGILIVFTAEKRAHVRYKRMAILILDGCSCDGGELFLSTLQQEQILLVFPPLHALNQTQPLDLGMFGPLMQFYSTSIRVSAISRQTAQVVKMADARQRATMTCITVSAFRAAGLVPNQ
jgi:hypothetical protein